LLRNKSRKTENADKSKLKLIKIEQKPLNKSNCISSNKKCKKSPKLKLKLYQDND